MKERLRTRYKVSGVKIKELALASLDTKSEYMSEDDKTVAPLSFVFVPVYEALKGVMLSRKMRSLLMLPVSISVRWFEKFYEDDVLDVCIEPVRTKGGLKVSFRITRDKKKMADGRIFFKEFKRR